MAGPLSLPPPPAVEDGMRVLITALVHQLGGSAVVSEIEIRRVVTARQTIRVEYDDMNNYILREVDAE